MLFLVGMAIVLASVLGGYMAMGGKLMVLFQPFEFVIIGGAAVGALIVGNPKELLGRIVHSLRYAMSGSRYDKESYLELLSLLYSVFKLAKTKGMLALEQ